MNVTIPGRKIRAICRETLKAIGPEATYEQVLERITAEGLSLSRDCFERNYQDLFVEKANVPLDYITPPLDSARLSDFIRFAVQVEAIGGIERARGYLDVLERLTTVL